MNKQDKKLIEEAQKQIAKASKKGSEVKQMIMVEQPYTNLKLLYSGPDWCLLTNGDKVLGVTKIEKAGIFGDFISIRELAYKYYATEEDIEKENKIQEQIQELKSKIGEN